MLRDVAQLGSALDWGSRGRWFESSRPDQKDRGTGFTGAFFHSLSSHLARLAIHGYHATSA